MSAARMQLNCSGKAVRATCLTKMHMLSIHHKRCGMAPTTRHGQSSQSAAIRKQMAHRSFPQGDLHTVCNRSLRIHGPMVRKGRGGNKFRRLHQYKSLPMYLRICWATQSVRLHRAMWEATSATLATADLAARSANMLPSLCHARSTLPATCKSVVCALVLQTWMGPACSDFNMKTRCQMCQ